MTHSFNPDELLTQIEIENRQAARIRELHLIKISGLIQELTPEDLTEVFEGLPLALKQKINWLTITKA